MLLLGLKLQAGLFDKYDKAHHPLAKYAFMQQRMEKIQNIIRVRKECDKVSLKQW